MGKTKTRIIIIITLIVTFGLLTAALSCASFIDFEKQIYLFLAAYINPALTAVMVAISGIGSLEVVSAVCLLLLLIPRVRFEIGLPIAAAMSIAAALNIVLKHLVERERPKILQLVTETGYSFPSGHTMNNTVFYTMLILIVFRLSKNRKTRLVVLFGGATMSFFIGISRIYLGVHYTGDVLGGFIMGVALAIIVDSVWIPTRERLINHMENREH